jgi:hypothetical protein
MKENVLALVMGNMLAMGVLLLLSGCSDAAYWWQRTALQIDCRPEHVLPNGQCAPVQKGGGDVQAAHP